MIRGSVRLWAWSFAAATVLTVLSTTQNYAGGHSARTPPFLFPLRHKGSGGSVRHPSPAAAMDELDVSLMRGTLDLLILKALSWGPRHGYAVAEWIGEATGTMLRIGEGTLYPALHRLERQELIEAEWGLSDNNRSAKFYTLSRSGRRRLQAGTSSWHEFVEAAGRALRANAPAPV